MDNERQFAARIRQALNEGVRSDAGVSARIAERLRMAREHALERRKVARESALAWAGVSGSLGGVGEFSLRVLLPTLLLVVALVTIYGVQKDQVAAEVEELDAMLLTDDLPIDAYLDRGFESWLKKVAAR
jgi:hypothetical protein